MRLTGNHSNRKTLAEASRLSTAPRWTNSNSRRRLHRSRRETGQPRIARVWPGYPEDAGDGIVRIDGRLRQQAGVGIDERVDVEKADVKPAQRVTIALPQNLRIGGNVGPMIRDKLSGRPSRRARRFPLASVSDRFPRCPAEDPAEDRSDRALRHGRRDRLHRHSGQRDARRAGPQRRGRTEASDTPE